MDIRITGWKDYKNQRRISLAQLIMEHQKCSLSEAKALVDGFAASGELSISVPDPSASAFLQAAESLGIVASTVDHAGR